ncbi:hypothetical protein CAPTEDRAFT_225479 [Capitella teleta]|uniref:Uncharacterized protein n=1 Tax=Capitella teleta TaxID=283909 RepID=R7VK92_CAPTE|nr:hypothetical protein CAPTEDRAFT_225479 [Capitella teleta]|eukprot:ELU17141.1 hypothetical protein CAPTEDRAFT_225479 [Capitella teleta]
MVLILGDVLDVLCSMLQDLPINQVHGYHHQPLTPNHPKNNPTERKNRRGHEMIDQKRQPMQTAPLGGYHTPRHYLIILSFIIIIIIFSNICTIN